MDLLESWIWLSSLYVSANTKAALLTAFQNDPKAIFTARETPLQELDGVSKKDAQLIAASDLHRVDEILRACDDAELEILTLTDSRYPERLRNIYAPPAVLYVRGRLPRVDRKASIAVIGTRKASPWGLMTGSRIAAEITLCGGLVVSGLTNGIDASAARGALDAGGPVIGVLGTAYGESSKELTKEVERCGAVVTEIAPGTPQQRSFFRERNRITAGLSVGVAVIEAPEKSGTRLFVQEALEQGKDIFATPGTPDPKLSAGIDRLLQEGAVEIASGWDILSEYTTLFPGQLSPVETAKTAPDETPESKTGSEKDIDIKKSSGYIDLQERLSGLTAEQLGIVAALEPQGTSADEIIAASGLPAARVLSQLTILEIQGILCRKNGNRFYLHIG